MAYLAIDISEAKLASRLGVHPRTFNGYFKFERQDNLWPLLPKILEVLTDISREWLYFGEGEMLRSQTAAPPNDELVELLRENRQLRIELEKHRAVEGNFAPTPAHGTSSAPGTTSAAPLQQKGTE
jgi:Predicted kinase